MATSTLPALPDLRTAARDAAQRYGIPRNIFDAMIERESGFNQNSIGAAGEIGLGQLKPSTAAQLGVNPYDPLDNLNGAAKYLRQHFDTFGSWRDALAAYNGGPGGSTSSAARSYADAVLAAAGIPAGATPGVVGMPGVNPKLAATRSEREAKEATTRAFSWKNFDSVLAWLRARGFDFLFGGAGLLLIAFGIWALMNSAGKAAARTDTGRDVRDAADAFARGVRRVRSSSSSSSSSKPRRERPALIDVTPKREPAAAPAPKQIAAPAAAPAAVQSDGKKIVIAGATDAESARAALKAHGAKLAPKS